MPSNRERLTKQWIRCSSRSKIGAEPISSREWPDIFLKVVRDDAGSCQVSRLPEPVHQTLTLMWTSMHGPG